VPADLYRDANLGIRARLAELDARIREREGEVTEAFWSSLDPGVRERFASMRERIEVTASRTASFEDLAHAERALAGYLDELERLIAGLPALEEEWRALPDAVPDPPPPQSTFPAGSNMPSTEERNELFRTFAATVRERDREAEIVGDSRHSLVARFHDYEAPFSLRANAHTNGKGQIMEVSMWLVTSVARATPRLTVRHESLALTFGKLFGIKHEIEVGDPSFDGLFLIEGARDAALRLLSAHVQSLLLTLSRFDIPTLEILPEERLASLRWRFSPAAKALDAAVRVLASLRDARSEVQFRR
jgi:hypothetical protein